MGGEGGGGGANFCVRSTLLQENAFGSSHPADTLHQHRLIKHSSTAQDTNNALFWIWLQMEGNRQLQIERGGGERGEGGGEE